MGKQVRMALIGSGSGSTGAAAIDAFQSGVIPSVSEIVAFISTVPGAGLLQKAADRGIRYYTADDSKGREAFHEQVRDFVEKYEINLLVSAGCRALLPEIKDVCMVNTHPEEKEWHGGHHMVGLAPHLHFLEHEIIDKLWRGRADLYTAFYARITFHYIGGYMSIKSATPFDTGTTIMEKPVLMPREIIEKAWTIRAPCRNKDGSWNREKEMDRRDAMDILAQEIQDYVLIQERQILPVFIEEIAEHIVLG